MTIDSGETTEVERADPRARRTVLLLFSVGSAAGLFLIAIGESQLPALQRWLTSDPALFAARMRTVAGAMAIAFAGPALAMAAYCWRLGARIVRHDRFPPPDTRIIRDVRVVRGARARRRARILQALAIVFTIAALGFITMLSKLVSTLPGSGGG